MSTVTEPRVAPEEATDEQVRAAALAWAQEWGPCEKLPRGVRGHTMLCPLGRATGMAVSATYAFDPMHGGLDITLPVLVGEFVRRFDNQRLPDLDLEAGES